MAWEASLAYLVASGEEACLRAHLWADLQDARACPMAVVGVVVEDQEVVHATAAPWEVVLATAVGRQMRVAVFRKMEVVDHQTTVVVRVMVAHP